MEAKRKPMEEVFSSNLRRLLDEKGATQADLARYMGISTPTVNNWCKGKIMPLLSKLDALCAFFLCTPSDLCLEHFPVVQEEVYDYTRERPVTEEEQREFEEIMRQEKLFKLLSNNPDLMEEVVATIYDEPLKALISDYLGSDERGKENIRATASREAERQRREASGVIAC